MALPFLTPSGTAVGTSLDGTSFETALQPGGSLNTESGYQPASWLVGTGLVDVGLAMSPATAAPVHESKGIELK